MGNQPGQSVRRRCMSPLKATVGMLSASLPGIGPSLMIVAGVTAGAYPLLRLRRRDTLFDHRPAHKRPRVWHSRSVDLAWSLMGGVMFAAAYRWL